MLPKISLTDHMNFNTVSIKTFDKPLSNKYQIETKKTMIGNITIDIMKE